MRRQMYGLVAAFAFMLALTGCDGGEPETGGQLTAAPSLDTQAKGVKFAQCMRENGIDVPDPEPGKPGKMLFSGNVSQEQVQKAMEACREWAPEGALGGGKQDPKRAEQMLKYAQCMRDNGVEAFPDPDGAGLRMDKAVADDPDFKTAEGTCAKELQPEAAK